MRRPRRRFPARRVMRRLFSAAAAPYWQVAPLAAVFAAFFLLPLALTAVVSVWRYNEYAIIPAFVGDNYASVFAGCVSGLPELCLTFRTYLSTLKFCALVWAFTLAVGFAVAYFLAFHVRSLTVQVVLFLIWGVGVSYSAAIISQYPIK